VEIKNIIWLDSIVDKLLWKHNVTQNEIIQIFNNKPHIRFVEKGFIVDENVYSALNQTDRGRYLIIFFVYKLSKSILIISGRDMTDKERRYYEKH